MPLVVGDSAGAVIPPKSIEPSSKSHQDRFGIPRNLTGAGSPAYTMLVSPAGRSVGIAPRLAPGGAATSLLATRSKSCQSSLPGSSSAAASTVAASVPGAAALDAYVLR